MNGVLVKCSRPVVRCVAVACLAALLAFLAFWGRAEEVGLGLADRIYKDISSFLIEQKMPIREAHAVANEIYVHLTKHIERNQGVLPPKSQDEIYDESAGLLVAAKLSRGVVNQAMGRVLVLLTNGIISEKLHPPLDAFMITAEREITNGMIRTNIYWSGPEIVRVDRISLLTNIISKPKWLEGNIQFGVLTLNPYTIVKTNGNYEINKKGSDVLAYLRLGVDRRWAWRDPDEDEVLGCWNHWDYWDFSGNIMYVFNNSDEVSASTIIGSGDLSADLSVGFNLGRYAGKHSAFSITPELSFGIVTDSSALDIHPRVFFGPSLIFSTENFPGVPDGKRFKMLMRTGYVHFERPNMQSTSNNLVKPKYTFPDFAKQSGYGIEMEANYPIRENLSFLTGVRIYGCSSPNPWTVYIGASYDLNKLINTLPGID